VICDRRIPGFFLLNRVKVIHSCDLTGVVHKLKLEEYILYPISDLNDRARD